jgi:hypothetical protein
MWFPVTVRPASAVRRAVTAFTAAAMVGVGGQGLVGGVDRGGPP